VTDRGSDDVAARLAAAIRLKGPISVAHYMAAANAHYYGHCDPLGAAGDFTTAPEISQMFGEMIGAWLADLWNRAGRPTAHYVELGPGRGTLACDAVRAMAPGGLTPQIHLVETSPVLRAVQARRLPNVVFHDDISTLPNEGALMIIANEFFDALPIHQLIRGAENWHERRVSCHGPLFLPVATKAVPESLIPKPLRQAPAGSIIESSPTSVAIVTALARRIKSQGGAALMIDYGYDGPAVGETLQAVKGHAFANPFDAPGHQDLSAHVDFATLAQAALMAGVGVAGPVGQGDFLSRLGIGERAAVLAAASPERRDGLEAAYARLTGPDNMGTLFRVMACHDPRWPEPAGF
jgi:NADH dehydrogenase [ubiquinone] 1 alpha subcomplex assembly factor 7